MKKILADFQQFSQANKFTKRTRKDIKGELIRTRSLTYFITYKSNDPNIPSF